MTHSETTRTTAVATTLATTTLANVAAVIETTAAAIPIMLDKSAINAILRRTSTTTVRDVVPRNNVGDRHRLLAGKIAPHETIITKGQSTGSIEGAAAAAAAIPSDNDQRYHEMTGPVE
jgi:uncharacterized Zn-binding protein involved in type VI secretion